MSLNKYIPIIQWLTDIYLFKLYFSIKSASSYIGLLFFRFVIYHNPVRASIKISGFLQPLI